MEGAYKKIVSLNLGIPSVEPSLRAAGYHIFYRSLHSKAENWMRIVHFLEDLNEETDLVLAKFTEYTLFLTTLPDYAHPLDLLISQIRRLKHMVYIYEQNLSGVFSCATNEPPYYSMQQDLDDLPWDIGDLDTIKNIATASPTATSTTPAYTYLVKWCNLNGICDYAITLNAMADTVRRITTSLSVAPYRTLTDIHLGVSAFVDACIRGLVLRVYVPTERIWSSEVEKIIRLFQNYALSVQGRDIQLVQEHTELGTIYSLYSRRQDVRVDDVPVMFNEFIAFLDVCARDPQRASDLLKDVASLPSERVSQIIIKYTKEAKRLALDIRQEAERKLLAIRHRLEAELADEAIAEVVNNELRVALTGSEASRTLVLPLAPPVVNITVNNQYISTVNGIVSSQIYGRVNYNEHDNCILNLILLHSRSDAERTELQSALAELKDENTKQPARTMAWQKIRSFLAFVSDKVADVGVAILTKYLESLLSKPGG